MQARSATFVDSRTLSCMKAAPNEPLQFGKILNLKKKKKKNIVQVSTFKHQKSVSIPPPQPVGQIEELKAGRQNRQEL